MKKLSIISSLAVAAALQVPVAQAAIVWSTGVDTTSTTTNEMRSVDVSDQLGNNSVYVGYIQTTGGNRDVRQFDTTSGPPPVFPLLNSKTTNLPGSGNDQPKAIASDLLGNVVIGNRVSGGTSAKLTVHNSTLTTATDYINATDIPINQFGGLAIQKVGGNSYLYASRETNGEIRRYNLTYTGNAITGISLDTAFGTSGIYTVPGAVAGTELRGLAVEADGTIYVASRAGNKVYRIANDLSGATTATVTAAEDIAEYAGHLYVTNYNGTASQIDVLSADTLALDSTIVLTTLDGNPYSRGTTSGFAGIDVDSAGRLFMVDEHYNVAGTTSDRLLVSSPIPEPASLGALALSGLLLARRPRKARETV
jgi:hypothetical protein